MEARLRAKIYHSISKAARPQPGTFISASFCYSPLNISTFDQKAGIFVSTEGGTITALVSALILLSGPITLDSGSGDGSLHELRLMRVLS